MKVACPHCKAAYNIDDRRIPATGLKVRCPKCRNAFPVRLPGAGGAQAGAVQLPAPAGAVRAPAPPAVPLPPPSGAAAVPPGIPLPAPEPPPFGAPPPLPVPGASVPLPPPVQQEPLPVPEEPPAPPGPAVRVRPPLPEIEPPTPGEPMPAAPVLGTEPVFGTEPALGSEPFVAEPVPAPPAPAEALAFGEVDLGGETPPAAHDPFAGGAAGAAAASGAPTAAPPPSEELEMLFGEGAPKPAARAAGGYKVRRRSGKIFGPFDEPQVVEMLGKGELMGNEDVSADGGTTWTPIGAVPAFGDALRTLAAQPATARPPPSPAQPQRVAPFGTRMAAAKVTEGHLPPKPWAKIAIPLGILVLLGIVGAGAGYTRYGFFFTKVFHRADSARVAAVLPQIRAALARGDFRSERAALDLAAQAVAADPGAALPAALHAMIAASLEQRHGAPPGALELARREADRLDEDAKGEVPALAARLAVTLAAAAGTSTAPQETALEHAAQKRPPDADVVVLLARAALARGDAARAGALFSRLEALEPAGPRAPHGQGLVAVLRRDAASAKAGFEKALARAPDHLASRVELAALAEAAGDVDGAQAQLAPVLAEGAAAKLAPLERARALLVRASMLARSAASSGDADEAYQAAIEADGRLLEARIALARHRLHRADAAGAVSATEPVAQAAASSPALAAVRIRALAAAGRALDASSLAQAALQKTPGDPALLLARAVALEASGKADEAAALYQDAAARDPAGFEPRLALGRIALAKNDLGKATAEVKAAVERGPREPAAHAALGELEAAQGHVAEAEAAFGAALGLDPKFAPAEIGLAKLALARGDTQGARARLERALAADPHNVEGHVAYGSILWKARELPGAEKAFQAAVDLAPLHPVALARLGAVKLERDDVSGAVQRLTAASNEAPRLPEAHRWLGRALLRKGETPGAIAQFRRAIELEPANRENHLDLGAALERSGAPVEAIDAYRMATTLDPRYVDAWERIGAVYATNGRFQEAIPAYEKAIAAAPRLSRLRIALGECKVKLGKNDEAARIFREVLKSDPSAVQAIYRLARAVHETEGARAALPLYERAAREEPKNAMPHYYLGYLYKERNQRARAIQEFKRYLELRPDADEKKDIESEIEDLGGR